MSKILKLSDEKRAEIVNFVRDTYDARDSKMATYKRRMQKIKEEISSFESRKTEKRQTSFKVNKAHEIENKVVTKMVARDPKWLVSINTHQFKKDTEWMDDEQRRKEYELMTDASMAIRDYLTATFKNRNVREVIRIRARNMIRYGNAFAKVCYRYDINRDYNHKEEVEYDEEGNEIKVDKYDTIEDVVGEYPSIEAKSWTEVVYNPEFLRLEDMSGVIDVTRWLRLSHFSLNKDKYDKRSLEQLVDVARIDGEMGMDAYKQAVLVASGVNFVWNEKIDFSDLTVTTYHWLYDLSDKEDGSNEKLYEFQVLNGLLLMSAKPITQIPFEDVKCFEDTEAFFATGFIEPILGLQKELNHKKNAASTYINQSLYRSWIRSPLSGINPKNLHSAPGNIIPTKNSVADAMNNLMEIPYRNIPPAYFNEQNDFERQIQAASFTVDTASPRSDQALTNTATGIKIQQFETNAVADYARQHLEEGMTSLAYKLLQLTFENMDENIYIKKSGSNEFREINKELMRDAVRRYAIQIETGSSSFDSIEQRRADAIAKWNISVQAKQNGVDVNLDKVFKGILETFEGVDPNELVKPAPLLPQVQQTPPWGWSSPLGVPGGKAPQPSLGMSLPTL